MSSSLYQIYKAAVFQLVNTMVVNHTAAAITINKVLTEQGYPVVPPGEDPADQTQWKYYVNMAGLYHISDTLKLTALQGSAYPHMTIMVAGDTAPVQVDFTADLVSGTDADFSIGNEYQFGSAAYDALLARYPDFNVLINGILKPVPLAISSTAKDGEILICGDYIKTVYPNGVRGFALLANSANGLVEPNEDNLISELQRFIYTYIYRWDNSTYALTDDLYVASFLMILYCQLVMAVFNIRLENCRTPRAHSFHYTMYANSYNGLGQYVPYFNLSQNLWLYRNLRYLRANPGKQSTFKLLVDNVLTPAGVPLASYTMEHDISAMPTELSPTATMYRRAINFDSVGASATNLTVEHVFGLEAPCARQNSISPDIDAVTIQGIKDKMIYGRFNRVETKILQSEMIDNIGSAVLPLSEMLINMWLWSATNGLYTGNVFVSNPVSGASIQVTPLNAFILAVYCWNIGLLNITPVTIPAMWADCIPLPQTVLADIPLAAIPPPATMLNVIDNSRLGLADVSAVIGTYAPKYKFHSATAFLTGVTANYKEWLRRYKNYVQYEDAFDYAGMSYCTQMCYNVLTNCDLAEGANYADWLLSNGIVLTDFTTADYLSLATQLVEQATGVLTDPAQTLAETQQACMAVMRAFSSYTVQYVSSITTTPTIVGGFSTLRVSNVISTLGMTYLRHAQINPYYRFYNPHVFGISFTGPSVGVSNLNPDVIPPVMKVTLPDLHSELRQNIGTLRATVSSPAVSNLRFVGLTQPYATFSM